MCWGRATIFRQVRAIPPGHILHVWAQPEILSSDPFGSLSGQTRARSSRSRVGRPDAPARARYSREAHDCRCASGRFPVGRHPFRRRGCSDGRSSQSDITVFTAGFPNSKIDETAAAQAVAEHLGCRHVILPIEPETASNLLPAVQRAFDEPSAANSAIPLWYLFSRRPARQGGPLRRGRR